MRKDLAATVCEHSPGNLLRLCYHDLLIDELPKAWKTCIANGHSPKHFWVVPADDGKRVCLRVALLSAAHRAVFVQHHNQGLPLALLSKFFLIFLFALFGSRRFKS